MQNHHPHFCSQGHSRSAAGMWRYLYDRGPQRGTMEFPLSVSGIGLNPEKMLNIELQLNFTVFIAVYSSL